MTRKFKKYSLNQKKKYFGNIIDENLQLKADGKPYSHRRLDYATGFRSGVDHGIPNKFDTMSKPKKLGVLAGVKARIKSNLNKG